MIARAAWGSLRDAENVLEQLAVSSAAVRQTDDEVSITEADARELLGLGDSSASLDLATALLEKDAAKALNVINAQASLGADLQALRNGTVEALRAGLLIKAGVRDAQDQPARGVGGHAPDRAVDIGRPSAARIVRSGAGTDEGRHVVSAIARTGRAQGRDATAGRPSGGCTPRPRCRRRTVRSSPHHLDQPDHRVPPAHLRLDVRPPRRGSPLDRCRAPCAKSRAHRHPAAR